MEKLTLYSTLGCHLCDLAKTLIDQVLAQPSFHQLKIQVDIVDIAASDDLINLYGTRIPVVLMWDANQQPRELDWPFDAEQFINWWISGLQ